MNERQESYRRELGESFGRRLREARLAAGLSTARLAIAAGVSRNMVLLAESGRGGGTALAAVASLADAIGVPRAWLAFGEGHRE